MLPKLIYGYFRPSSTFSNFTKSLTTANSSLRGKNIKLPYLSVTLLPSPIVGKVSGTHFFLFLPAAPALPLGVCNPFLHGFLASIISALNCSVFLAPKLLYVRAPIILSNCLRIILFESSVSFGVLTFFRVSSSDLFTPYCSFFLYINSSLSRPTLSTENSKACGLFS